MKGQFITNIKKHIQLLPLLVLTAYCIDAAITAIQGTVVMAGETYDFELTTKHYFAFITLAINFAAYFFLRRFYKYILSATLLVGFFNLIVFSALESTWGIGIGSLEIKFQPAAFLAGLVAYIINRKQVNKIILDQLKSDVSPEEAEKKAKVFWEGEVGKFKERYQNYSADDLNLIVTENKYVPAALEAARQLLNEKGKLTVDNETNN